MWKILQATSIKSELIETGVEARNRGIGRRFTIRTQGDESLCEVHAELGITIPTLIVDDREPHIEHGRTVLGQLIAKQGRAAIVQAQATIKKRGHSPTASDRVAHPRAE